MHWVCLSINWKLFRQHNIYDWCATALTPCAFPSFDCCIPAHVSLFGFFVFAFHEFVYIN